MKYPRILNKHLALLSILKNTTIVEIVKSTVCNDMTVDILVGKCADKLAFLPEIQDINDMSYNFKKCLLIRVKIVVDAMKFQFNETNKVGFDKDGAMFMYTSRTIINQKDQKVYEKEWFYEAQNFIDTVTLKGSNKIVDNNSTDMLEKKSEIPFRVKTLNKSHLNLYTVLLYEATRAKVNDSNYYQRLCNIKEETMTFSNHSYTNYRKLDSNGRNYPLSRFGFAYEYGNSFEKNLIEVDQFYTVNQDDVDGAIEYLQSEYKCIDVETKYVEYLEALEHNLSLLPIYNRGKIVEFTMDHKGLGKLLHFVEVMNNIIYNLAGQTRQTVSYDFTNSGLINASNQFGDEQFLKVMNLRGDEKKVDTHQLIADFLGLPRDEAKKVVQGSNHGGRVRDDLVETVENIFGPTYHYIHKIAMYGKQLALAGVTSVELIRPDGVKTVWYPYTLASKVSMEDGSVISAITPYGGNGDGKHMGLAVSILHSADATVEAHIQSTLQNQGVYIKTTLDNFYCRPSLKADIVSLAFEAWDMLDGYAERSLQSIERQTGILRGWELPQRTHALVESYNII